jgi:hypothetical protein
MNHCKLPKGENMQFQQDMYILVNTQNILLLAMMNQDMTLLFFPEGGVGQTQARMPAYVSILRIPQMI